MMDRSRDLGSCGTSIKTNRGRHANTQRQAAENMHRRTHKKCKTTKNTRSSSAGGAGAREGEGCCEALK